MQLLHELVPVATSIAVLFNPNNLARETEEVKKAAVTLGVRLLMFDASSRSDIESAFEQMVQQQAGALVVTADPIFIGYHDQIIALAARHAIPAAFVLRDAVRAGGLLSYGAKPADIFRQVGAYSGRILKGEKPENLPVQQPVKFEMAINLKAAKALGLDVPTSILLRADEVIE